MCVLGYMHAVCEANFSQLMTGKINVMMRNLRQRKVSIPSKARGDTSPPTGGKRVNSSSSTSLRATSK